MMTAIKRVVSLAALERKSNKKVIIFKAKGSVNTESFVVLN